MAGGPIKTDSAVGERDRGAGPRHPGHLAHVASGAIINFSGIIARTVILYLYTFMLARMLTADELGEFFLVSIIINYLALVATVGFGTGVMRFVALYAGEGKNDMARHTMWLSLLIGVPLGIVFAGGIFLFAPALNGLLFHDSPTAVAGIRVFAVAIPLLVAAQIFNSTTQGMHRMKYQVYSRDLAEQLSKFGFSGAVLVLGAGLIGVIGANVASVAVAASMAFVFALMVLPKPEKTDTKLTAPARPFISYSLPLAFSGILVTVQTKVDTLLLGYFTTSANVGYYVVALKVAIFSIIINHAFATVFAPIIVDLWNRKRKEELSILFKTVARWIFIFSLPIFIVLVVLAEPIMGLFGEAFVFSGSALIVLAFGELINNSTGATGLMVLMSGHSKLELFNVALAFVINAMICLFMIPRYGIMGAAIANMFSIGILNLMRAIEVWFLMRLHAYEKSYLKPVIAGATGALLLFIVSHFVITHIGPVQLVILAGGLVVYYVLAMLAMGLTAQDKIIISTAKTRLKGIS